MLMRLAGRSSNLMANADLLAGTSIGSTIVSSLVAGQSPIQVYEGLVIGGPKFYRHPKTNPRRPAFDINQVAATQRAVHSGNPPLSSFRKKVLFTTFDVGSAGHAWQPLLLNNFRSSDNRHTGIVDAVVSSAAMPGSFGSYKRHIDGAFVDHDPTTAAIALAVHSGVRLEDIVVICFGTGLMKQWVASDTSNWGAKQWQNGDGNRRSRTPAPIANGSISPVLSARLDGPSANLTPHLASLMLGGRYAYLNPTLDRFIAEDDTNPRDLAYLESSAANVDISPAVKLVSKYW
jgi:patatin-like phospholipase/acyl hydrolase